MSIFNLPDLGEGLQDAQIIEWKVKLGDLILIDQVLVSVETAKATVDIPSPYEGKVIRLYGKEGDVIETGKPLIEFSENQSMNSDSNTIVGKVEASSEVLKENLFQESTNQGNEKKNSIRIMPVARILAKKLNLDINLIKSSGPNNTITLEDVKKASNKIQDNNINQKLSPKARSMALHMEKINQDIVPVTIMDDADLYKWDQNSDLMIRVIRAIIKAKEAEPSLNMHYNHETLSIKVFKEIHLGIAVDRVGTLYVPVIKDVANLSNREIREKINNFKIKAKDQSFTPSDLAGPTMIISNYGSIMGKYATPIVVPPTVLIIGIGKLRDQVVPFNGKPAIHKILPLSLTIDHRALTGGEVARFLKIFVEDLEKDN